MLSKWLKSNDKGKIQTLKLQTAGSEALYKALFQWFVHPMEQTIALSAEVLKETVKRMSYRLKILKLRMGGLITGKLPIMKHFRLLLPKEVMYA